MWSTSVARSRTPALAHSLQNGSLRSCSARRCFHSSVLYIQSQDLASSLRSTRTGLCLSQYPSVTRTKHPGCRQGRRGLLTDIGKTKRAQARSDVLTSGSAQAQWLRLSVFTMASRLQFLHHKGKLMRTVSGRILWVVWRPHIGHTARPPRTVSIAHSGAFFNVFSMFFSLYDHKIYIAPRIKNKRPYVRRGLPLLGKGNRYLMYM